MKKIKLLGAIITLTFSTGVFAQQITGSSLFSPTAGGARILSGQGNTAANPAIGFQSSVSTTATAENDGGGGNGIFRPIANNMAFATGSQERMRINQSGWLGVGTPNPTAAIHVLTGSTAGMLPPVIKLDRNDATNQAGLLSVGISGNGFASGLLGGGSAYFKLEDPYGNSANSDMGFSTNANAAQMVIKHNGFVGIGTETPTANFHSIGTARLQSLPTSTSNTNIITTDANGNLFSQAASSLVTSTAWDLNGNTGTNPLTDFMGTTDNNSLNFRTNNLNRMTLLPNGNLGLGTTTPTAALHLVTGVGTNQTPSVIKLDRNDATNQAGLLSVGISGNGFATGLLGGGSAYFKLEDPYGNSANSDMGFSTNANAAQMVIKHNGFVGIGTETPTANLHSIGTARLESLPTSTSNTNIITTDANGNLSSQSASSLFPATSGWNINGNSLTSPTDFIGTLTNDPFNVYTNNTQRAIITPTGEMGIGTTTPTSQLEVSTTNITAPAIKANGKSVGVYAEATAQESNLIKRSNIYGDLDGIAVFGNAKYTTNIANGSMYGVVGSATEINPLNNVGVFGEAKNANGYNHGVVGYVNSPTGIYNSGVSGLVTLNTAAVYNRAIWGEAPVAPNHFAGYFNGNVDIKSGVVTIGDGSLCTPSGYKLFVEQGILTEKVKVAVSCSPAWADYVFEPNYNLKPLSEVEAYVKENKHLPNVPSASELVKEGLDLGKMQATQMEKIEELTLYMIEMKKEIEMLKKENESLKVLVAQPKN